MRRFLENNHKAIITLVMLFMFAVSTLNAWWDSAIFDETAHIPAGYSYLTAHDIRLNPEHPPLLKDLAAIPLLFLHLKFDTTQKFWTTDINGQWEAGKSLFWQSGNNPDLLIFLARMPIVILSLVFGFFIFKWVKELAGTLAGLFALVLYAFDPNILGHNHFVTTDLGIAGFMMISFYYFLRFIKKPTWKNVALGGLFLGIVQLTKFSSIMLFPIYGIVMIAYPMFKIARQDHENTFGFRMKTIGEYLLKGTAAFAVSLVVVWGLYFFNTYNMPKEKLAETINYYFSPTDTNPTNLYTNHALIVLNQTSLTRPLSGYVLGIAMVFKRVEGGNGAYFMGQVSNSAFGNYFPTVFAIKEPIQNLFLFASALAIAIIGILASIVRHLKKPFGEMFPAGEFSAFIRHNITAISLLGFVALYAYISITGNLNIGFRHLFPILPFAYILTAKTVFDFIKRQKTHNEKVIFRSIVLLLSLTLIVQTALAYPYYMSYFNQIAGGPKNGYHYVTDSNADWGQDLKRLKSFLAIHPEITKIRVDYFGGADIKYYIWGKYEMWWDSKRPIESGWYAISTNFLQGSLYDKTKPDNQSYRWIEKFTPKYQVGTSILVYYISPNDLNQIK